MEDKNHPEKEATMPLLEHLDELRRRIIRSMIAVLLLFLRQFSSPVKFWSS